MQTTCLKSKKQNAVMIWLFCFLGICDVHIHLLACSLLVHAAELRTKLFFVRFGGQSVGSKMFTGGTRLIKVWEPLPYLSIHGHHDRPQLWWSILMFFIISFQETVRKTQV